VYLEDLHFTTEFCITISDTPSRKWYVRAKKYLLDMQKEEQKQAQPQLYGTSYLLVRNTLTGQFGAGLGDHVMPDLAQDLRLAFRGCPYQQLQHIAAVWSAIVLPGAGSNPQCCRSRLGEDWLGSRAQAPRRGQRDPNVGSRCPRCLER